MIVTILGKGGHSISKNIKGKVLFKLNLRSDPA
jgi:hypothetical protein